MKIYFAHPVNTYGSELERQLMVAIERLLPGAVVENPNQEVHQRGYQTTKLRTGNGMQYFEEEVLPQCDRCVILAFSEGTLGAGVVKEAQFFLALQQPVWEIDPYIASLTVIHRIDPKRALTVEQTRERIKKPW